MLVISNRPGHFYIVTIHPGNEGLPFLEEAPGGIRGKSPIPLGETWATPLSDSTAQKKELLPFHLTLPWLLLVLLLCLMLWDWLWVWFDLVGPALSTLHNCWESIWPQGFVAVFRMLCVWAPVLRHNWQYQGNRKCLPYTEYHVKQMVKAFSFYKYITWDSRTGVHQQRKE